MVSSLPVCFIFLIYVMHVQADGNKITKTNLKVGVRTGVTVVTPKKGISADGHGFNTSMAALLETEADQGRSTPGPHSNANASNKSQSPIPQKSAPKANVCNLSLIFK